ncbi:hypothetical protein PT2222_160241 [Paraburkholderia tropica]
MHDVGHRGRGGIEERLDERRGGRRGHGGGSDGGLGHGCSRRQTRTDSDNGAQRPEHAATPSLSKNATKTRARLRGGVRADAFIPTTSSRCFIETHIMNGYNVCQQTVSLSGTL